MLIFQERRCCTLFFPSAPCVTVWNFCFFQRTGREIFFAQRMREITGIWRFTTPSRDRGSDRHARVSGRIARPSQIRSQSAEESLSQRVTLDINEKEWLFIHLSRINPSVISREIEVIPPPSLSLSLSLPFSRFLRKHRRRLSKETLLQSAAREFFIPPH